MGACDYGDQGGRSWKDEWLKDVRGVGNDRCSVKKEEHMAHTIYERLREHLDSLPTGYPKTKSGVELKILQKLFTEEEAEMACQLKPVPEPAEQIAQRLGQDPQAVADLPLSHVPKRSHLSD